MMHLKSTPFSKRKTKEISHANSTRLRLGVDDDQSKRSGSNTRSFSCNIYLNLREFLVRN